MKIAIIGAGINGLMTALEFVEHDCEVLIFDEPHAGTASWAGGGILSPMYPWRYPHPINTLACTAKSAYQTWNNKLKSITGIDFEVHNTGMLIFDESDFEQGLNYANQFHQPEQQATLITRQQISKINPKVSKKFQHALHFPQLANIRNPRLLASLKTYLSQNPNVQFFGACQPEQLLIEQNHGQLLSRDKHKKIVLDHIVITTGAWSKSWCKKLQVQFEIKPIQGQMLLFKTPSQWLSTMCMNQVMYMIPRLDGHILCGSSMQDIGFDTTTDHSTREHILKACYDMVPDLQQFNVIQHWAGLRPSSPTGIPAVGRVSGLQNVWLNIGHFRNGLCMAPASAELLRQRVLQQPTRVDPTPYQQQIQPLHVAENV